MSGSEDLRELRVEAADYPVVKACCDEETRETSIQGAEYEIFYNRSRRQ